MEQLRYCKFILLCDGLFSCMLVCFVIFRQMFLMAESQTNRGVANTQILSERIQVEWRDRFIGHAHTVNQKLKNAWDWNSSRKHAGLSSNAISKVMEFYHPFHDQRASVPRSRNILIITPEGTGLVTTKR